MLATCVLEQHVRPSRPCGLQIDEHPNLHTSSPLNYQPMQASCIWSVHSRLMTTPTCTAATLSTTSLCRHHVSSLYTPH